MRQSQHKELYDSLMNFITGLHKLLVNQYFTLWSKKCDSEKTQLLLYVS